MKFNEQQIMEFAQLFDDIITSESVAVQSAFQRLTLLNALAKTERDHSGPFEQLVRQIDWMEHELSSMRRDIQVLQNQYTVNITKDYSYKIDPGQFVNLSMNNTMGVTAHELKPLTVADITTITLPHDLS